MASDSLATPTHTPTPPLFSSRNKSLTFNLQRQKKVRTNEHKTGRLSPFVSSYLLPQDPKYTTENGENPAFVLPHTFNFYTDLRSPQFGVCSMHRLKKKTYYSRHHFKEQSRFVLRHKQPEQPSTRTHTHYTMNPLQDRTAPQLWLVLMAVHKRVLCTLAPVLKAWLIFLIYNENLRKGHMLVKNTVISLICPISPVCFVAPL